MAVVALGVVVSCAVKHDAGILRAIEGHLVTCNHGCGLDEGNVLCKQWCVEQQDAECVDAGFELDCGVDNFEPDKRGW